MSVAAGRDAREHDDERGAALVLVLMATALLLALGLSLLIVADVEVESVANERSGAAAFYAADAALELAVAEASTVTDWSSLLTGAQPSSFCDSTGVLQTSWGARVDVPMLTAGLQRESDAAFGVGLDRPRWRVYVSTPLARVLPPGAPASAAYLLVWVADDAAETDGDPATDTNRTILLRARAIGLRGARRDVEAQIARPVPGGVPALLAWREVR